MIDDAEYVCNYYDLTFEIQNESIIFTTYKNGYTFSNVGVDWHYHRPEYYILQVFETDVQFNKSLLNYKYGRY